jgi:hypothetical protein
MFRDVAAARIHLLEPSRNAAAALGRVTWQFSRKMLDHRQAGTDPREVVDR